MSVTENSDSADKSSGDGSNRKFMQRFRRNKVEVPHAPDALAESATELSEEADQEKAQPKEKLRHRFRQAMSRTSRGFGDLLLGERIIDDDLLEELEILLLQADVGVEAATGIIETLMERVKRRELHNGKALTKALQRLLLDILAPCEAPLEFAPADKPRVLLVIGVNGVGKTTTIGKLARRYQAENLSVMLAAGDTFRAAAVEQLQHWGERNEVPVIAQHTGADSASVIFDAIESAQSKNADLLIADTAGRLHTKSNLMEELKKVKRVMAKLDPAAPHEVLLVLDAGTGMNALAQMKEFHDAIGVTGVVLTKLDGTAKGGIIFPLCQKFGVPVRFVGLGEGIDDMQPFRAEEFINALFSFDRDG